MLNSKKAFTIVELLIVIVVIGILATISIVTYNGIQERAKTASIQAELNSLGKLALIYNVNHGSFPVGGPAFAKMIDQLGLWDQTRVAEQSLAYCSTGDKVMYFPSPERYLGEAEGKEVIYMHSDTGMSKLAYSESLPGPTHIAKVCRAAGFGTSYHSAWAHSLTENDRSAN